MLLNKIDRPQDIKLFRVDALSQICSELRETIIDVVSKNGGHLGANLGVVELTVALHYVFDFPTDKIVWDIGHQAYSHKILTERRDKFATLRHEGGLSGFLKRDESLYDSFGAGHSSTSISAAFGMEIARALKNKTHQVIAVIGDAALGAGMAYEALNHAGAIPNNLIVILNDNQMSIGPTTGALSNYLKKRSQVPAFKSIWNRVKSWKLGSERAQHERCLFGDLGFECIGPLDGHDLSSVIAELQRIKASKRRSKPILIHVLTEKGRGYQLPDKTQERFHAIEPACSKASPTAVQKPTYTQIFSSSLVREASLDGRIVAITAAMVSGVGLRPFRERFPDRCFDVGIAEQHAVTFAAGLACDGLSPFVAIYSTFLQRAYDQVVHDVAVQKLPVRFAIDRAGLVGRDGPTHAGAFDVAFLSILPNFVVMCPSDGHELADMVHTAADYSDGPIAFRYPRGKAASSMLYPPRMTSMASYQPQQLTIGKGRIVSAGNDVAILVLGTRLSEALKAARILKKQYNLSITVADARFAKPIDELLVLELLKNHKALITVEDGSIGGFSAQVNHFILKQGLNQNRQIRNLCLPDQFINHGDAESLYDSYTDLNACAMVEILKQVLDLSNVTFLRTEFDRYAHQG